MDLLSIRTDDGVRSAIVIKTGPTFAHVIWADDRTPGVRINKIPKIWMRYATPLEYKGKPYPLSRAKRLFRKMGRSLGITKAAKKELRA
jgi:hypothetical protein